ncbi:MAG: hypothetical protein EBR32_00660 [Bacteroidetes bacterium]|nr:hypothetical protein [Bacteroidota bacterium]
MINNPISLPNTALAGSLESPKSKPDLSDIGKDFELIFAKKLVAEMTKNQFEMGGEGALLSSGSDLYRHHITDILAKELANQGSLGIAELIQKYKQ